MEIEDDAEAIRQLARSHEARSKIGKLRELYSTIEEARRAGVSNKKIMETLNARGYDLTIKTFESMLHRIRKERENEPPEVHTVTTPPTANTPLTSLFTGPTSDHRPGTGGDQSPVSRKITNPAELRKARERELDLDHYREPDPEE